MTYTSPGEILKRIRIKHSLTLRRFCLDRGLDAKRFSMIERDVISSTTEELDYYMELIKPEKVGKYRRLS